MRSTKHDKNTKGISLDATQEKGFIDAVMFRMRATLKPLPIYPAVNSPTGLHAILISRMPEHYAQ